MIELQNVSKTYHGDAVPVYALRDVSLTINEGEFVAIMGPSGSGKSTLLHTLGFLDRPDDGSYTLFGYETVALDENERAAIRNHVFGFVFQQFHLLRRVSALENTELPRVYAGATEVRPYAVKNLEAVGLGHRISHYPNQMSGGEQQRVAIARALVNEPKIVFADEPTGNLDSKSEEEIIGLLKDLNQRGKTIIMVTHEKEVAEHAKRIIMMRDGKIQSDTYTAVAAQTSSSPKRSDQSIITDIVSEKHTSLGRMECFQYLRQSLRAICSNKVRSFLSMLGILFGVAAVIAMMALGEGARTSMEDHLKSLGSNLLVLRGGSRRMGGVASGSGSVTRFSSSDVAMISEMMPHVRRVSGDCRGSGQVVYQNENWSTTIEGVGYQYGEMRASIPTVGRWFTHDEINRREKVAIVGTSVAEKLFGAENPVGKVFKINRINFRVIGVAPEKGAMGPHDRDDVVFIPLSTAMHRVLGKNYIDRIYVEVSDAALIDEATERITEAVRKRHRLYATENSFEIRDMSEIQQMLTSTTKTMSMLLGSIAAISLLVGGIGIMNIMLVSVTERTREIGLRKAIGARRVDILGQFLVESVVMTFCGGILGIVIGVGASFLMAILFGWATRVSLFSVVLATTFSIAVGVGFGIWPAKKAAALDPIDALRYE